MTGGMANSWAGYMVRAVVTKIEDRPQGQVAHVIDHFGKPRVLWRHHLRARGMLPEVGEMWIIARDLGHWTFAAILTAKPPPVTGNCEGNTALWSLLQTLDSHGIIDNQATLGTHIHPPHGH